MLIAGLAALAESRSAAAGEVCLGRAVTTSGSGAIEGTTGNDVILESPGRDVILGLGGTDVVCALGGNDLLDRCDGGDGAGDTASSTCETIIGVP